MTKGEQARLWAWRLRVIKEADTETRNVARTCRYFGISRQAFYRWKRRYEAHGEAGLWDRPKRPHRSPTALPREVVSKILYLRQHYHFGPSRIADYLKRFHQLAVAVSSVHRTLKRHGMNRLPANQKHRSHVKRWHHRSHIWRCTLRCTRFDVESFRIEPSRSTGELKSSHSVCSRDQPSHSYIDGTETGPAASGHDEDRRLPEGGLLRRRFGDGQLNDVFTGRQIRERDSKPDGDGL